MTDTRVCFLGDSFTLGQGDEEGLGWVGRLFQAERGRGVQLTAYNLGVRGQTGAQIAERASAEVSARLSGQGERQGLVISFGANDLYQGRPLSESVQALRGLLRWSAGEGLRAFFIAAPPTEDPALDGLRAQLQDALLQVCRDLAAPALDLRAAVADWSAWRAEARAGDGVHPGAQGYQHVAEAVGGWSAWRDWLDAVQ